MTAMADVDKLWVEAEAWLDKHFEQTSDEMAVTILSALLNRIGQKRGQVEILKVLSAKSLLHLSKKNAEAKPEPEVVVGVMALYDVWDAHMEQHGLEASIRALVRIVVAVGMHAGNDLLPRLLDTIAENLRKQSNNHSISLN